MRDGAAARIPRPAFWGRAALLIAFRPWLWATAVRQTIRLARPRWWRRVPFLPVPDRDYLGFRFETQYGADGRPDARDVVAYLRWCRAMDRSAKAEKRPRPPRTPR